MLPGSYTQRSISLVEQSLEALEPSLEDANRFNHPVSRRRINGQRVYETRANWLASSESPPMAKPLFVAFHSATVIVVARHLFQTGTHMLTSLAGMRNCTSTGTHCSWDRI